MPSRNDPRQPLLGPWPPFEWRQDVEEKNRFPAISLRQELLDALAAIHQAADEGAYPAAPPREILTLLNDVGPRLDERSLPVIEMLLDDLCARGLAGFVPAPTPHHAKRYLSKAAAEIAVRQNAPVILLPLVKDITATRWHRSAQPEGAMKSMDDTRRHDASSDDEPDPQVLFASHRRTGEPLGDGEVRAIVAAGLATADEFEMRGGRLWWHRATFPDHEDGD